MNKNFSDTEIKLKLTQRINGKITSKELGDWADEGVYYYLEGEGKDVSNKVVEDVLQNISAQWAIFGGREQEWSFPKDWLEKWLKKLKKK